jgi:hypothetical protein
VRRPVSEELCVKPPKLEQKVYQIFPTSAARPSTKWLGRQHAFLGPMFTRSLCQCHQTILFLVRPRLRTRNGVISSLHRPDQIMPRVMLLDSTYFENHVLTTLPKTCPNAPLTLCGLSATVAITIATLVAKTACSRILYRFSYTLGSNVASALGTTKNAISCRRLRFSNRILHPHAMQPAKTQRPESHIWRVTCSEEKSRGPRRVRARQTP